MPSGRFTTYTQLRLVLDGGGSVPASITCKYGRPIPEHAKVYGLGASNRQDTPVYKGKVSYAYSEHLLSIGLLLERWHQAQQCTPTKKLMPWHPSVLCSEQAARSFCQVRGQKRHSIAHTCTAMSWDKRSLECALPLGCPAMLLCSCPPSPYRGTSVARPHQNCQANVAAGQTDSSNAIAKGQFPL